MAIHYFIERSLKTPLSIQVMNAILVLFTLLSITEAFTSISGISTLRPSESKLFMGTDEETKAAPLVSGEDLEMMLTEWDQPLVVDAYATW